MLCSERFPGPSEPYAGHPSSLYLCIGRHLDSYSHEACLRLPAQSASPFVVQAGPVPPPSDVTK